MKATQFKEVNVQLIKEKLEKVRKENKAFYVGTFYPEKLIPKNGKSEKENLFEAIMNNVKVDKDHGSNKLMNCIPKTIFFTQILKKPEELEQKLLIDTITDKNCLNSCIARVHQKTGAGIVYLRVWAKKYDPEFVDIDVNAEGRKKTVIKKRDLGCSDCSII